MKYQKPNKLQTILGSNCRIKRLQFKATKNGLETYDNIQKIATGQGNGCKTDFLLDSPYSKKYYKMIAIELSNQQALDANPKAIQQINFIGNLT